MKLCDVFVGQTVKSTSSGKMGDKRIPEIGTVVGIALEYDTAILCHAEQEREFRVLPVVKFVGEEIPRQVAVENITNKF